MKNAQKNYKTQQPFSYASWPSLPPHTAWYTDVLCSFWCAPYHSLCSITILEPSELMWRLELVHFCRPWWRTSSRIDQSFFFKSKRMFLAFPAVENAYMYVITVYTLHFVLCGLSAFDSWWEYIVAEIDTIAFIRLLFSFEIRDTVHPSGHSYWSSH